jgi:hypothetical protein
MIPSCAAVALLLLVFASSSLMQVATAQNGTTGALRRANKIKPPKCPANQQYLPAVQIGCPASCDQPIPMCKAAIAPGCGCPDGLVLAGGGSSTTSSRPPRSPEQCISPKLCEKKNAVTPPMTSWSECPNGAMPLANTAHCGRGGSPCPTGYTCNIDPLDRFAVCCPDAYVSPPSPSPPPPPAASQCPSGAAPLGGAFCGRGGSPCPNGHDCVIDPTDRFAVCCPQNGVVTPRPSLAQCPRGATPLANGASCGRGGQRCPKGFKCNIDPLDRFAVCCPDHS